MLIWLIGFCLGAVLGSFCDVLANRSLTVAKAKESFWGRSHCLSCRKQLKWYDLIPVVSFLLLKAKCRYCHKKIPTELLLVEIVMGLLAAVIVSNSLAGVDIAKLEPIPALYFATQIATKLFILIIAVAVVITDLKTGLIPNRITYPAIFISAALVIANAAIRTWYFYSEFIKEEVSEFLMPPHSDYLSRQLWYIWQDASYFFLISIALTLFFVALIIVTRGRGMGWGDVKYVAFLGLALGLYDSLVAVFLAFFLGALVAIGLLLFGQKRFGQTIPFGPFLSLGAIVALLYGQQILSWYNMMY